MHTFSGVYPASQKSDESHYIQAVLKDGDLTEHFFDVTDKGPLTDIAEILNFLDEPRWAYNAHLTWNLLKIASSSNLRVVLDGFDGDTTLSHGEGLFNEWAYKGQWLRLFRELRAVSAKLNLPFWPWYRGLVWQHGLCNRLPRTLKDIVAFGRKLGLKSNAKVVVDKYCLFTEEVSRRNNLSQKLRQAQQSELRDHKQLHLHRLQSTLLPYYMEDLDAVSSAQGIEPRYPFFDRELAEFCLALPWQYKLHNGMSRVIARLALAGVLPDEICCRPDKANLSHGFDFGFNHHDRSLILDRLGQNPSGMLDEATLCKLKDKFYLTTGSGSEKMLIWRLICMNLWWDRPARNTTVFA